MIFTRYFKDSIIKKAENIKLKKHLLDNWGNNRESRLMKVQKRILNLQRAVIMQIL